MESRVQLQTNRPGHDLSVPFVILAAFGDHDVTASSNMYARAKMCNPLKGCNSVCRYCTPNFQQQPKRQKQLCNACYDYTPHCHEDRLTGSIPSAPIVFVCGNANISFCPPRLHTPDH